jgi:hypothetical protein
MALTAKDQTDLLLPLLTGSAEPRPYATFLTRLQRRCGAVHASLHVRVGPHNLVSYWTGPNLMERARETGMDELAELDRIQYDSLRPGRVYAPQEYFDSDPIRRSWRMQHMVRLGVADERAIRVLAEPEISAWLVIAAKQSFGAGDSALLSSLAPYVAATVRNTAIQHRARATETLAEASLARAGIGWIAFDREGAITALAERTRERPSPARFHSARPIRARYR